MSILILVRHGQSEWNRRNLFTGWVDVPLSEQGVQEALQAGRVLKNIPIDEVCTSSLIRAQMTALLSMTQHSSGRIPILPQETEEKEGWSAIHGPAALEAVIPVKVAWQLNERMYGELQGLDKEETRRRFGEEQVKVWRRSFATPPPGGESLKMTKERTVPFFEAELEPLLSKGKNLAIFAHGNSIRSLMMHLEGLSEEEVLSLEVPTGHPILYRYESGAFTSIEPAEATEPHES